MIDIRKSLLDYEVVPKLWGSETWLCNNEKYCGKILHIKPGFQSSLHYHKIKDETFYVLFGIVCMELYPQDKAQGFPRGYRLEEGESVRLMPGVAHRFWSPSGAEVIEFSTTHMEPDVVRLEESRVRDDNPVVDNPVLREELARGLAAYGEWLRTNKEWLSRKFKRGGEDAIEGR